MAESNPPEKAALEPQAAPEKSEDGTATEQTKRASVNPTLPVPTAADKETGAVSSSSPRTSSQVEWNEDTVNPIDFQGEVLSNDDLPSRETIRRIGDYTVLDRYGKTHTFKSLYTGRNVARRVLIIFVRHFFCGVSAAPGP